MLKGIEMMRQRRAERKSSWARRGKQFLPSSDSLVSKSHPDANSSVILVGCADDLVVSDTGHEYARRSVRRDRLVYPPAAALAEGVPCSRG
jgi:hypothetical protein